MTQTSSKKPLFGKRVAFCGARRSVELSALIGKLGGTPLPRPMMATEALDAPAVKAAVKGFAETGADWFVATTGMGVRALLEVAQTLDAEKRVLDHLGTCNLAARGYKTVKALKDLGFKPDVLDDDGTLEGLRRQLESVDFANKRVAVQLHGTRVPELTDWLEAQGAEVLEIPLYQYLEPSEKEVTRFVLEIASGKVDAVAFTSNTQVRFLFDIARRLGIADFLAEAFARNVQAVSVGVMTTQALRDAGVKDIVAPQQERMGAMVMTLAGRYKKEEERRKTEATTYPVVLTGLAKVVVVGGGKVATRKVKGLLEAGVTPKVISPQLSPTLQALKDEGSLEHGARGFQAGDTADAQLVIAASNDALVNEAVAAEAKANAVLVNVADAPQLGTCHTVASVRRGELLVSVSTGGQSPGLAGVLRAQWAETFPEAYADVAALSGELREELKPLSKEVRDDVYRFLLRKAQAGESLSREGVLGFLEGEGASLKTS